MDAASEANLYMNYERQRHEATGQRPVLPVTIITGFLGAGKTTLLRNILRSKHNLRIAAVVNEYGSVDHDGGVIEREGTADSVDKLAGGCVCCQASLGDDLEKKVAELLAQPAHAEDRYDYLVIETSGVSNPDSVIRALDKTFGKLTRARLDSVVVVVDGDSLFHQLDNNDQGEGAAVSVSLMRQLESADIILLNKADLLDESQLSELAGKVSAINPFAKVEACSYGKVPLHVVLDVEAPRTDIQGVSHERVKTHLNVSSKGGNLRKASPVLKQENGGQQIVSNGRNGCSAEVSEHNRASNGPTKVSKAGHLRDDGLEQITFTASLALSLARFQDWVSYGMPAGAVRVKGVLAFDEDRLTRAVFNMSGRRRLSFDSGGKWEGPMNLHLVVIGVGMDRDEVLSSLEGMLVPSSVPAGLATAALPRSKYPDNHCSVVDGERDRSRLREAEMEKIAEILAKDPLFDAVAQDAEPACPSNIVRFRFTGAGAYGILPSQLSIKFGVDLDAVNRAILRSVNSGTRPSGDDVTGNNSALRRQHAAAAGSDNTADLTTTALHATGDKNFPVIFLTYQEGVEAAGSSRAGTGGGEEECVVLRYAIGGDVLLAEAWPMIVERTREVMKSQLGHVHFCNCFS